MKKKLILLPGSYFQENFNSLVCPICKLENIHCYTGEVETIKREGFKIPMWCENYHKFTLVWEFHEGSNQIYWEYENIVRRDEE